MKTPIEDVALTPEETKPPGGKALERFKLFAGERGLPIEASSAEEPKAGSTKRREAAEAQPEAASVAQTYFDAANTLAAVSAPVPAPGAPPPPSWRPLGPTSIPNGQTYGASRVTVSGRVAAVAVDPGNRNHILVGAAAGGIWESLDRGGTWVPRTDFMPTLTTGAIAFDHPHPSVVYAGTGEGNWYQHWGVGVLKSTNGGTTWAVLATNPFVGQGFYDLIVDPANSNHLLGATTGGIYESANAGVNWTQHRNRTCWSLSMHPAGGPNAEVLAACSDGLYRSTNGGQTWAAVALPGAPAGWNRLAAAIARSNPAIAFAFGASGNNAYLYFRDPAGTWHQIGTPPGLSISQAWYDWFVAVAPNTQNTIYLGAIDAYRGDFSGVAWTWTDISTKGAGADSIHPDQHAITFDPTDPNAIYIGDDGGLFYSPNRGLNWLQLNTGLAITEIEYIAQDYGSTRWVMGGTQDNGSIRYTGSPVWDHIADGDGGDCAVNHTNPDSVFHSYYGMGAYRSVNRGDSWAGIGPPIPPNYGALFYPPMGNNGDLIAQGGQSVFISRNNGTNWSEVALPANRLATAIHIPTTDRVFVGCTDGSLFRIDWNGANWSAVNALTTPRAGAGISDIAVDASNINRIWVTSSMLGGSRVFRSDSGGTGANAWHDQSAGLPNLPINAVEIDPGNANRVWVGADLGVYQSFDAGVTWQAFSGGLPNVLVEDLDYHPYARVLRAGTRNRGVWEIPVDGWLTDPICGTQWTGTLPPNGQGRWFTFNWPAVWHVIWMVMPTNPKPGAPQVTWSVQIERASAVYATYWITVKNLTNAPLTFEGRYCILSFY